MRINRPRGFARDHGADDIADGEGFRSLGFGFALGGDGVGSFARLRNQHRHRIRSQDRVAIAPLAGVVDFDRNAGESLDHVLAGESSMPTGAAGGDIDFLQRFELGLGDLHFVEENGAGILRDAAERGVADGAGLLIDFLEHEVLEAALFRHDGVPGNTLGFALQRMAVEIGDAHSILREYGNIAIREKEKIARVIE